jgi:hypothetical protein
MMPLPTWVNDILFIVSPFKLPRYLSAFLAAFQASMLPDQIGGPSSI